MAVDSEELGSIPDRTGVYIFRNGEGEVIYVGKAISLRSRVKSHFHLSTEDPKEEMIRRDTEEVNYFVCGSETEALVLENNLIKQFSPCYNVRMKDDKTYPYVRITVPDECPGMYITRFLDDDGSRYFGPYADAGALKRVVAYLRRTFGLRRCRGVKSFGTAEKACLDHQLGLCAGPCAGMIEREDYDRAVQQVMMFLEGSLDPLLSNLADEMLKLSKEQRYERAAVVRDRMGDIKKLAERQRVSKPFSGDMDVVGVSVKGELACVTVFMVRRGNLVGKEDNIVPVPLHTGPGEIIGAFVEQRYLGKPDAPKRILVTHGMDNKKFIEGWFGSKGIRTRISKAHRPMDREWRQLCLSNAEERLLREFRLERKDPALVELKEILGLPDVPERIEGVDISNMSGERAVGSVVVFSGGRPDRKKYRRYRIRTVEGTDDYAMVREVVRRRFKRLVAEGKKLPGLLLIDGGKGHLSSADDVLKEIKVNVPVISIAKRREEVFGTDSKKPMDLSQCPEAHSLLRRVRDEAHRFAITYHRKIGRKSIKRSELEKIRGVGAGRRKALLRSFGSVKRVREASVEEIMKVPGIGKELARVIAGHLKRDGNDME